MDRITDGKARPRRPQAQHKKLLYRRGAMAYKSRSVIHLFCNVFNPLFAISSLSQLLRPCSPQTQHKKVLDKGRPDDSMAGIPDRAMDLPGDTNAIPGLLNNVGAKVRRDTYCLMLCIAWLLRQRHRYRLHCDVALASNAQVLLM